MPPLDEERLEIAASVRDALAAENVLSADQARAFVRCLQTAWQVPAIHWEDAESRDQLDDAGRLIHAAGIFSEINGATSADAVLCYRRAGELLEWLSRARDTVSTIAPIELMAAASYQLGGLPAMATGLIGQVELRDTGSRLFARFLRADFDAVLRSAANFWRRHPELTEQEASVQLLGTDADDKISWYLTVELVRSLGLISDSLRRGETRRLDRALQKLRALDSLAVRSFSDYTSMLITLLFKVAESYRNASIYGPVRQLAQLNPDRTSRLLAFARGQFSRGRGILWTSQRHGIARLIEEPSFALCTPTGSGKTLVANLALVKELLLRDQDDLAPLSLYLVPSRALAGEVEAKLTGELGHDFIITGLYGGADWGVTDYWLNADRPTVLIATVEKADALMRYLGPILLARLRLLIIDEAHQVVPDDDPNSGASFADHSNRSVRLESFVSRLLAQAPDIVRIALTAVAGGAAPPVARWIEGRADAEAVGTRYQSTRQVIGVLETVPEQPGRMLLDLMNGQPLYVRGRDEPVYIRLRTPPMPRLPAAMRNSVYRFNQLHVLWTALHLKDQERRILISVAQQPEQTMRWYAEVLELDEWAGAGAFELPEDEYHQARFQETRAACIDYCGPDSYEVALLDRGIATNHGQMPQRLRRLMTDIIERGICPLTVATATLTEGVNLPFDIIFVAALKRRSFDPDMNQPIIRPLSTGEFRNLAGRAGRPGSADGTEGITLVAIPQRPSTTAQSQLRQQRRQIRELDRDYNNLRRALIAEEREEVDIRSPLALLLSDIAERVHDLFGLEGGDFLDWLEAAIPFEISEDAGRSETDETARLADTVDELDGILLAALEELARPEARALDGADAEAFLTDLWRRTFTAYAAVQEEWLERAFIRRGRAIIEEIYPDAGERKRLYQYGFPPYLGRRFHAVAPDIRNVIEAAAQYGRAAPEERFAGFAALGRLVSQDRGFGFRVRPTATDQALLDNWEDVLSWWMQRPDAIGPEPRELRSWQRFVADNLEFRLGVAVGAVVAQAWSDGADDPFAIPSLAAWRETTGLPWFGFWARELLRWGTLDPFVAFALAQGLAPTREDALQRRLTFEAWLNEQYDELESEDFIDPQLFLEWQRSLPRRERPAAEEETVRVELTGTTGERGLYHVIPVRREEQIDWIDAAGFSLARSPVEQNRRWFPRDDFELRTDGHELLVHRVFTGR